MDWSNEEYVKVYRRETDDDLLLSWEARALWAAMMIKFDRSGLIPTRRAARGLAAVVRIPLDVTERALPELLEDGRVVQVGGGYFAPNFLTAQEATKSDKLRQRESRQRKAELLSQSTAVVTKRDGAVTNRDETSRDVTSSHAASQTVTLSSADPPLCSADPEDLSHAHARAIPPPSAPAPVPAPKAAPALTSAPSSTSRSAFDQNAVAARAVGDLALATWQRVSDERMAAAARLGLTGVIPFRVVHPGRQPTEFDELRQRIREEGEHAARVCAHVIAVLVEQADREQNLDWLSEKVFLEGAWRTARETVLGASRARAGPRSAPASSSDPRFGRITPPPATAFVKGEIKL
jgi:hypothetical protein